MPNTDSQYYLRRQEEKLNNIQSKLAGNTRILELRDDPMAASHAVRYESMLSRLRRFETNTLYAKEHYNMAHDKMYAANEILQRMRELALAGANGTNTPENLKIMAVEVNELIKELVDISNSRGQDAKQLFSGDKAFTEPFRTVEGTVEGGGEQMILRVEYRGAGASRSTEITDGSYLDLDIGGGEVFWAEKMHIFSTVNATGYRVNGNGSFYIDGVEIPVTTGDTIHSIAAKINESPAPVKASVDMETQGLALEGTNAHLIRMEDGAEGGLHVLEDLGIIRGNPENNAPNWSNQARVYGGSVFDMAIRLRDALLRGDQDFIGSQGLGGMDLALGNLGLRMAQVGSRAERAEMAWTRLNQEIPDVSAALGRESYLDYAEAATELAMMDFVHRAALQTAARIIPPTLLDFLR
jgi:flagellar hook-associated protein 3 FlgL